MAAGLLFLAVALVAAGPPPVDVGIPDDIAAAVGWSREPAGPAFPLDWLSRRYGVQAPGVVRQLFVAAPVGWPVDIHFLAPRSRADAEALWRGLRDDLTPVQGLGRREDVLVWVQSDSPEERLRALALAGASSSAAPSYSLEWIAAELPAGTPGLSFTYGRFLSALFELERKVGDVSLRAVYQSSHTVTGRSPLRGLAQADFWVPRDPSRVAELARKLDDSKTAEQTIVSSEKLVSVLTTRTNEATLLLLEHFEKRGYRRVSRVPVFSPMRPSRP